MSAYIFAFSSRQDKNMSLKYGDTKDALSNRRRFLENLGIDYRSLVCGEQTHGNNVWCVRDEDIAKGALTPETAIKDTDALITDKKNIPIAVFTADCLSIFLFDPKTPAVGIAHAGWRSSEKNITTKTVRLMQQEFNTSPKDLSATFGPAIRACCYDLDLAQLNKNELLALGVKEKNIADCGLCTYCQNDRFFSYRKEGESAGRMVSVAMLKGGD